MLITQNWNIGVINSGFLHKKGEKFLIYFNALF